MKKLEARLMLSPDNILRVGTLAHSQGNIFFEYTPQFLVDGFDLSPFSLPFEASLYEHGNREFGPLPGLFDDSLPDGWGLLLMDRYFRQRGLKRENISPLHRLSWLGTKTMGALTYFPVADTEDIDPLFFDLHDLASQSWEILSGRSQEVLPQLLKAGGSPGGARPKVLVGYNSETDHVVSGMEELEAGYEHWMVKFSAKKESSSAGAIEYAYSLMARAAGIHMPKTRLFETSEGDRFFGVKRFDRDGRRRFHVHTFGNLIEANFRIPSNDYEDLLRATSTLTRNHQEILKVFRQMVFNVLAHNRDDHVKNFAFVRRDPGSEWAAAPAYDLTYSIGPGGEHTMTIAGEGRNPRLEHIMELSKRFDISRSEADEIIEQVHSATDRFTEFAGEAGIDPEDLPQFDKF